MRVSNTIRNACAAILVMGCYTAPLHAEEVERPTAADTITNVVSDVDLRLKVTNSVTPCQQDCETQREFDARVQALGAEIAERAYALDTDLKKRVKAFVFEISANTDPGTASSNAGRIVIFRGIQYLGLSDEALGYVIAREMGHVIAGHHKTNTGTKLLISALSSVLFPAVAVVSLGSTAAQASTATTLLTSAASTATSMVGSDVALKKMKPKQVTEADVFANQILQSQDWDKQTVSSVLMLDSDVITIQNDWIKHLNSSQMNLQASIDQENLAIEPLGDAFDTQPARAAE